MLRLIIYLGNNPHRGAICSVVSFILGLAPNMEKATIDIWVACFQLCACSISIIVGLLTIGAFIHNKIFSHKNKKKK